MMSEDDKIRSIYLNWKEIHDESSKKYSYRLDIIHICIKTKN